MLTMNNNHHLKKESPKQHEYYIKIQKTVNVHLVLAFEQDSYNICI